VIEAVPGGGEEEVAKLTTTRDDRCSCCFERNFE